MIDLGNHIYIPEINRILNSEAQQFVTENYIKENRVLIDESDLSLTDIIQAVKSVNQITLEVTQDCNLDCRYCLYGKAYPINRKKTKDSMTASIALDIIEYFWDLIKNRSKKEITISFYGGEPILEIELIMKVIEKTYSLFQEWKIDFGITTNGTLLNEKNINILNKNNIKLLISLDGPKYIHDKNRVYPNGRGSFLRIKRNIDELFNNHKGYYRSSVGYSVVWAPGNSLCEMADYFEDEVFSKNKFDLSQPVSMNTTYYQDKGTYLGPAIKDFNNLIERIEAKKRNNEITSFFENTVYNDPINILLGRRNASVMFGACLFNEKLYITSNGTIHICHMMNPTFPIGDVFNGLDYQRMLAIYEEYRNVIETNCLSCDLKYLCRRCYVMFAGDGRFRIDEGICEFQRKDITRRLKRYIQRKEATYI